jgi:ribosomal protein L37AE/L43A
MDIGTLVAIWLVCGIVAGIIGSAKNAGVQGFIFGVMLGPLGILAAFAVDGRMNCSQCGTKLNAGAKICPSCHEPVAGGLDLPDNASELAEMEYVRRMREKRQAD